MIRNLGPVILLTRHDVEESVEGCRPRITFCTCIVRCRYEDEHFVHSSLVAAAAIEDRSNLNKVHVNAKIRLDPMIPVVELDPVRR